MVVSLFLTGRIDAMIWQLSITYEVPLTAYYQNNYKFYTG